MIIVHKHKRKRKMTPRLIHFHATANRRLVKRSARDGLPIAEIVRRAVDAYLSGVRR